MFINIPVEIREKIYNNLNQNEVIPLRLVCNQLKYEIDNRYTFENIKLDDSNPNLQMLLQLRTNQFEILNLVKPISHYFGPSRSKFNPYDDEDEDNNIIKTRVRILKLKNISSRISAENFHILATNLDDYLEELDLFLDFKSQEKIPFFLQNVKYDFKNLKRLDISIEEDDFEIRQKLQPKITSNFFFQKCICNPVIFPNLKCFKISLNILDQVWISENDQNNFQNDPMGLLIPTFDFISRHGKTLESVQFFCSNFATEYSQDILLHPELLKRIDLTLLNKVKNLKTLNIQNSTGVAQNLWIDLAKNQKQLEDLKLIDVKINYQFILQIVFNNWGTLVSIFIEDFKILNEPFDMSVFKNCPRLKSITLKRDKNGVRFQNRSELINLSNLPEGIQYLKITSFRILSQDLTNYFQNFELHSNFKELILNKCNLNGNNLFGVNGSILKQILKLGTFNRVQINGFNDRVEKNKLDLIYKSLGYEKGEFLKTGSDYFIDVLKNYDEGRFFEDSQNFEGYRKVALI